ncbi:LytTR family DNA-binding domain-containing protein [Maricaulis sp.]|uniref:LytTR family DNA-binding domain-containing protein n=1 Tax=Maricaulis sp. TaxID=1486257 RepID=UPI00261EB374|nr:LytTR family DNA-binding domain-containing protein [Maricaulis sp.]
MTVPPITRSILKAVLATLVLGSLFAFLAPYRTAVLGWPGVWLYWLCMMGAGWGAGMAAEVVIPRLAPRWPPLAVYVGVAICASLSVIAATLIYHHLRGYPVSPGGYANVVLQVTILVSVVTGVYAFFQTRNRVPEPSGHRAEPDAAMAGAALLDRLPLKHQRAALHAIAAEDHYLRVYTSAGETLIRMRMSDALPAVAALDGAQTHRSWWVARDAVEGVRRGNGKAELSLSGAVTAPVSRSFAPALREAGWF